MKTPTPPAVSEELDIPKPAPGENVYPIYSQGVICGYIHSGGNQKTHKIFLNGENQTSSTENKCTKLKTNDSEKKSCPAKFSQKIAAKRTSTQSVSSKHKKAKTVSSTEKKTVLPNASSIESNILIENPSDKLNIPCSPTKQPNGDNVDLGNKGCMSNDSLSMPVFETPSELATSTANQNVQQIKTSTDCSLIDKQNSNAKSVVMTSSSLCSLSSSSVASLANKIVTSSNVNPSTKDTVVLSPPLMNNFNQPIVLASNNLALQSTNWVQPSWPNPVAYVIVPATNDLSQTPVYLANSTNNLSPVLPTVTNVSLTTTTTTTTTAVSTVDSLVQPPITISTANTPITKTSQVTTTTNSCNQLLTMLPLKGVVPKSTFVQLPLQLSSSINKKQPTDSPLKDLKILEHSNLENENNAFETTSTVNESSENITIQQSSKQEADNSIPALQSLNCTVSNDEKMSKESLSFGYNTQSNEGDMSSTELNKTVEEKTLDSNLSVNSDQKDKLETSSDAMVFISEENKSLPYQSFSENIKFTLVPVKKKRRGRPRKPLVPPKYERKQIPILPATANMEVKPVSKQHTFNLLPSGNYVICFQKETNDSSLSSGQSDELNVNLSQHENNQQVTCDKEKKRRGRKSKSKPSLCEEKEMPNLPNQTEINMKTEPLDEDSELNQEECESQSNNCASSASPLVENTQTKLPTKEGKDSETNSTIQEGENELVISNCFSLSSPTESNRKFIPFNITNFGLENLFHLPNQMDLYPESLDATSVVQEENSTKVAEEVKLKKCSVKLEQLNFPSNSLVESFLSSSEENNLPCKKPAENTNTFCNSTLKEDESNIAKETSSVSVSTLPTTDTKISLKTPSKSILDPEYLKKLKTNYLSVEKTEFPVLSSDSNDVSLESKSKSLSLSKDFLSGSINDALKAFDKSFGDLPFNADSIVANLPKDEEADAFIEGCIAFHQQQLYLLQLQMDQHKSTLEKLKKAQIYLKGTK